MLSYVAVRETSYYLKSLSSATWSYLKTDNLGAAINPNLYTVAVEVEGKGGDLFTPEAYAACAEIVAAVAARWRIPLDAKHVIAHQAVCASENCPGSGFDFEELLRLAKAAARAGHGLR